MVMVGLRLELFRVTVLVPALKPWYVASELLLLVRLKLIVKLLLPQDNGTAPLARVRL